MEIPIGVANSVSANFSYDPLDAFRFARQSNFKIFQIYLSENLLEQPEKLDAISGKLVPNPFRNIYIHAAGYLNKQFVESKYSKKLFAFMNQLENPRLIIHFDETAALEELLSIVEVIVKKQNSIYLENYFQSRGSVDAEKNLRKYLALFTLANSHQEKTHLFPVIDVPRFFHVNLEFEEEAALQWCFQIFNYFGNRQIPLLLHLIDCRDAKQKRSSYCAIGEGYIPYRKIFGFLRKTQPALDGIVLEYENKIDPLESRDALDNLINNA